MANEIPISVVDRKIKVGRHVPATMTNIGKDYLSISLDNEWSSTNHRLRVTLYSEAPYVSVQDWWDGKSAIEIPQEITSCPAFKVTVALLSEDGHERLVTQAMDEPIENPMNGHDEGAEPGARTMDIIARIDNLAADLEEKRDTDYWRGAPGAPGEPGADGYSPTASVTKNGGIATITVTDKNGTTTATVSDGAPGKDGSDATATDVRIAGKSITADGVANIPKATPSSLGLVMPYACDLYVNNGLLSLTTVRTASIDIRNGSTAIGPNRIDYAVKAAMCDGKGASWTADEQKAARERMNAADANKVYIMQKQIENLQGIAATEETDSTEAYTKTVPTGAQKWASLDKVGGKTVVWNQLARIAPTISPTYPKLETWANTYKIDGNSVAVTRGRDTDKLERLLIRYDKLFARHKYLAIATIASVPDGMTLNYVSFYIMNGGWSQSAFAKVNVASPGTYCAIFDNSGPNGTEADRAMFIVDAGYDTNVQIGMKTVFERPQLFDLTTMFGSGNEPTDISDPRIAAIKAYADAHPEYNPGELMSAEVVEVESMGKNLAIVDTFPIPDEVREMCPGYGWSAGSVCNEIDFERKVYVQRVGSVDLGTYTWNVYQRDERPFYYSNDVFTNTKNNVYLEYIYVGNAISVINNNGSHMRFYYENGTVLTESNKPSGLFYYELAEPIEVDLSDVLSDDNFIEVEAGGTVTFKQASTQLPVPSAVTYQISTKEVVANA